MADLRVWHPARDPYHCSFRILRLLFSKSDGIELERLRILDMFLLFPSMLHKASMPQDVRDSFRSLDVRRPEKIFIRLPSAAVIFQDLRVYQNSAMAQLAAKGLISASALQNAQALLQGELPFEVLQKIGSKNASDRGLAEFLVGPFSSIPLRGTASIYRRVGLPSREITA